MFYISGFYKFKKIYRIKKASQEKKIKLIIAHALESLKNLNDNKKKFDLVFIDADKENYKNYLVSLSDK